MIKRIIAGVVAIFAMAAAVATTVVAAAFALYAVLKPYIGQPGASAVVALVFAIIAGVVALIMGRKAAGQGGRRRHEPEPSRADRMVQIARERPILAGAGALAAGLIALKNPQAVASIVSAVMAARAADKADRRR